MRDRMTEAVSWGARFLDGRLPLWFVDVDPELWKSEIESRRVGYPG